MTEQASLTVIAVCQIILVVLLFAAVAAILYALFAVRQTINQKVDEAMQRIEPVLEHTKAVVEQARSAAECANRTVEGVSERVDAIVSRAQDTAESVTAKLEQAVSPQVIAAAGAAGTVLKCVQLYRDILELRRVASRQEREETAAEERPAAVRQQDTA